jgi:tetratricopeptide (TPR) repeat protein
VKRAYVINLASDTNPIEVTAVRRIPAFANHHLYTSQTRVNGRLWHRLRLGFFPDVRSAERAIEGLAATYPQAWIAQAPGSDTDSRSGTTVAMAPRSDRKSAAGDSRIGPAEMAKARVAMTVGYRRMATARRVASSSSRSSLTSAAMQSKVLNPSDNALGSECDELAAHPWDPQKIAKGRYWNQVPGERAVVACEAAIRGESNARNMFQYARALAKVKRFDEAAQWYSKAASLGYAQAQYAFGDVYEFGEGVLLNYEAAQKWYQRAADQGYVHATKRLTRLREAGFANGRQQMASVDPAKIPTTVSGNGSAMEETRRAMPPSR